jgi:serine phosphatase RsbU (regulator of sigma subunit)
MMEHQHDLAVVASLVDRLPDAVLLLDGDLKLVRYNPAFVAFSEIRRGKLDRAMDEAESVFDLVGDKTHVEIAQSCLQSGRPTRLEDVEIQSPSGRRTATVAFVPINSLEGKPIGLIYSIRDVSGEVEVHKRYKSLLKQEQDRIKALEEREAAITNDMLEAKLFQESLLPEPPQLDGIHLTVRFMPADLVSGDLYDVHPIENGVRILVADASGHGVQASLRTMVLKTEYDQIKGTAPDPSRLLAQLNNKFCQSYSQVQFHFTACVIDVLRPPGGRPRLRSSFAGHPGLLRLSGGIVTEISAPGSYPGLMPDVEYGLVEVDLAAGDRLLAFSDGLLDQARRDGTQFNEARVPNVLQRMPGSVDDAIDRALGELIGFLGEDPLTDDITVVGVEID